MENEASISEGTCRGWNEPSFSLHTTPVYQVYQILNSNKQQIEDFRI